MANRAPSEEELHYRSLISLFKFALAGAGAVSIVLGLLIYSNGKEMRDDFREQRKDMKDEIAEMKSELNEAKAVMKSEAMALINETRNSVGQTKLDAINQISEVKNTSTLIAKEEATRSINTVFDNKNLDQFIVDVAKERIEPQIKSLVDSKIAETKAKQKQALLENLKSQDRIKIIMGFQTLQANPEIDLSESQISLIVNEVNKTKDEALINTLGAMFLMRKSEAINKFFLKALEAKGENEQLRTTAFQYFLINEEQLNEIIPYIIDVIKSSSRPQDGYSYFIDQASNLNAKALILLLDNKSIVDFVYDKMGIESIKVYKQEVRYTIRKRVKDNLINGTYFFSRQ
ncbi:hypothetical protein VRU48_08055 [Pedobacter sp. KR3-3]|uniref:Uncharacterized protein n=1 Tax=Pedobacter albus TaxID=3113905 RepID=A0ABU7I6Y2_9SPHI|nr:hypothetical protein [Pedobacter sp. KR3-3]MEE1945056.1 hypothetical protein [Pedobacter sp. KR3-3]